MSASATTTSASPLQQYLRKATRQAHHELDHHPLLAPLLTAGLSRTQYGNALAALHGIQARSEARILACVQQHPGLSEYRLHFRLPALQADLAVLGRVPVAVPTHWPELHSIAAMVGMLYVTEGSNLGGQVIARTIRNHAHGDLPLQFFSGDGESSQHTWQAFWDFANTHCPCNQYQFAAITAIAVFDDIQAHLTSTEGKFAVDNFLPSSGVVE